MTSDLLSISYSENSTLKFYIKIVSFGGSAIFERFFDKYRFFSYDMISPCNYRNTRTKYKPPEVIVKIHLNLSRITAVLMSILNENLLFSGYRSHFQILHESFRFLLYNISMRIN